jgi:hypothetical protein
MIKILEDNSVFEAIQLMNKSTKENLYGGYERNETMWISFFMNIMLEQKKGNPNYLAIAEYNNDKLSGFLLASTFESYYNGNYIMDVKDCIVDKDNSTPFTVIKLFNYMIQHVKKHGGTRWRADSIRESIHSKNYVKLLQLKFGAEVYYSAHGIVSGD